MTEPLKTSIEAALKKTLGAYGFDHAEIKEDFDHDGEAAVFVTAVLRPAAPPIPGDVSGSANVVIAQVMENAGDERFSYLYIRRPDDERPIDEEATVSPS
jgi:hypothetical protein